MRHTFEVVTCVLLVTLSCYGVAASRGAAPPAFEQYRTADIYSGAVANARIATTEDRLFRTRLREAARTEKINFAGHYILTTWGCGAECLQAAAIDAKTGRVHWVPFTVCCFPEEVDDPVRFRIDSSLIVFSGLRNEEGRKHESHFYRFDGKRFAHIASLPVEKKANEMRDGPRELRERYDKLGRPQQTQ